MRPWAAAPGDAETVARLLDAFNREYDTATPGVDVLAGRLRRLLAEGEVIALRRARPARPGARQHAAARGGGGRPGA